MFMGQFVHSLDAKGRVTVPARFRDDLRGGIVITRGLYDPCLDLYPRDDWVVMSYAGNKTLPSSSVNGHKFNRLRYGFAAEVKLDSMGRILIPAFLREMAGIDSEAMIVGANNMLEIWEPERFRASVAEDIGRRDIIDEMSNLGV